MGLGEGCLDAELTKREGGRHEDGADSLESVGECPRRLPVRSSDIGLERRAGRTSSAIHDLWSRGSQLGGINIPGAWRREMLHTIPKTIKAVMTIYGGERKVGAQLGAESAPRAGPTSLMMADHISSSAKALVPTTLTTMTMPQKTDGEEARSARHSSSRPTVLATLTRDPNAWRDGVCPIAHSQSGGGDCAQDHQSAHGIIYAENSTHVREEG